MPIIPAFWEAKVGGSLEVRSLKPAWTSWQIPVSTKNTKNGWRFGKPRWADHLRSGVPDQLGQHGRNPVSTKNTKISRAWWRTPVVPATREAEAGESLEPGRRRLR
ncbi:putative uncharacterized protein C8orf44 [Plecturocebus cupreus]